MAINLLKYLGETTCLPRINNAMFRALLTLLIILSWNENKFDEKIIFFSFEKKKKSLRKKSSREAIGRVQKKSLSI